jgi:hypothetical protein
MHKPFSTRVTAHNFATYAQASVTVFLTHKRMSHFSFQLPHDINICPISHSSYQMHVNFVCLSIQSITLIGIQQPTTNRTSIIHHGTHLSHLLCSMPLP